MTNYDKPGPDYESIAVTRTSQLSGIRRTLIFHMRWDDYARWLDGELIQKALPYLTAEEREFLMAGITADEWDDLFEEDLNNGP